jgi:serine/threonine protein kinase
LTGNAPFTGQNEQDTYKKITNLDLFKCEVYDGLSDPAKDFISRILLTNPKNRLSLTEMLNHEWIKC